MAITLPTIIPISQYGNNFTTYYVAIYSIFVRDFVTTQPTFRGTRLGLKKHPEVDNKEYTFYHLTHSGPDEQNRTPDLNRMARMPWPRPIIDNSYDADVRVWENTRRGKGGTSIRILIWHVAEDYLIILDKRPTFILPWTAYGNLSDRKKKTLLAEYDNYIKAEAAKN